MSTDGILEYQGTKRVLYRGDTSNIVFDTRTTSLGIGVTGSNNPSSNLYTISTPVRVLLLVNGVHKPCRTSREGVGLLLPPRGSLSGVIVRQKVPMREHVKVTGIAEPVGVAHAHARDTARAMYAST